VLLSVVDHAERVVRGTKKRVVGILLGQDNGKTINVSNSFAGQSTTSPSYVLPVLKRLALPVPFEEDERDPRTWFLDHNYIESMNDMFKNVNGALQHSRTLDMAAPL
jgi:26S proteasome regulatory subunit N8